MHRKFGWVSSGDLLPIFFRQKGVGCEAGGAIATSWGSCGSQSSRTHPTLLKGGASYLPVERCMRKYNAEHGDKRNSKPVIPKVNEKYTNALACSEATPNIDVE